MNYTEKTENKVLNKPKKKAANIPVDKLHTFEGHPFKVLDNEEMALLTESIKERGIRTASEVVQEALQDEIFMRTSGGGITVSGGEPLLYPEFTAAVLKETKARGLHTAIETCAYAKKSAIEKVLPYVDLFFVDLKAMDCKLHTELTRVGNEKILENVKFIAKHADKELIIRIPVIPEGNMSDENLEKTALFVKDELGQNIQVQLLPYHNYGDSKKENLGRNDIVSFRKPTEEEMEHAMDIFTKYGIAVQNGGFV